MLPQTHGCVGVHTMKIGERLKSAWCLILWEFMNVPWKRFHVLFSHASWILMFPIKKQNIPAFTKWVGFNSIICKYLYIFPKNTWAELHFFLITYMPQYIILAPTSCTCKTELLDEKSVQNDNKLADCCKKNNLSGMQLRPEQMWYEVIFHYSFSGLCLQKSFLTSNLSPTNAYTHT